MKHRVKTAELVAFLKNKTIDSASFVDNIKIAYRPYVCPFDDLLNYLPDNSSVFDIGCGSGMLLSLIAAFKKPQKLGGCEISRRLVDNANEVLAKENKNTKVYYFDGESIPDEVKDFNYITMIDVLHHIPKGKQFAFLEQLVDKISVGSCLIIKDIKRESVLSYWNKVHDLMLAGEIGNELNSKKLKNYMEERLSLKLLSYTSRRMLLYPHFTLIFEKL
ncbi:MAG: hypothetical protein CMC96_12505 [Flavobacteriales bacterium]|nr:hypothetical protein [Flavobacteriales bacterium]|tara:strand:+ start:23015 stop:23671 length:657 start_codon:yes stop_codon:yes gene_type:complete